MFKVVIVTDLDRLSGDAKRYAFQGLDRLSYSKGVKVYRIPSHAKEITEELFRDCDAVIVRPTDFIQLNPSHFVYAHNPVRVFTVSEGVNHLKAFQGDARFELIKLPKDRSNDRGVAALNFMLAHALFCRMPINTNNIDLRAFRCTTDQTNLIGKNWLVLGAGKQASRLLELGYASGIKSFYVWNKPMTEDHISRCLGPITSLVGSALVRIHNAATATLTFPNGHQVRFIFTSEFGEFCSEVDVISVHLPLTTEPYGGREPTIRFVNKDFIQSFARRPMLINTSRGELISEGDVWNALKDGSLGGAAVDVLSQDVERFSDFSKSKLWSGRVKYQAALQSSEPPLRDDGLNLIITPHIGGSVDTDNLPMWKFVLKKLEELTT